MSLFCRRRPLLRLALDPPSPLRDRRLHRPPEVAVGDLGQVALGRELDAVNPKRMVCACVNVERTIVRVHEISNYIKKRVIKREIRLVMCSRDIANLGNDESDQCQLSHCRTEHIRYFVSVTILKNTSGNKNSIE